MRVGHHGQDGNGSDSEDEDGRRRRRRRKDEGEEEGGDREKVSDMIIINFSFKQQELVNMSHLTFACSTTMTVQSSNTVEREKRRRKTTFTVETCKYKIITQDLTHPCPRFLPCTLHWVKLKEGRFLVLW